eukprot:TRINITY_DN9770_c0_g1_i2.p1 TRINITY_DN9770_c0_g1~~TRINITY_DN9770_c0_g1_i2.p1  ORF type:complete len:901 (-),score=138.39 TRINITY_DN9770_c0_g1_i2:151-2853(-)
MGSSRAEFRERLVELAQEHETVVAERNDLQEELRVLRDQLSLGLSSKSLLEKHPVQALPAAASDREPPSLLKELVNSSTNVPTQSDHVADQVALHVPDEEERWLAKSFDSPRQASEKSDEPIWNIALSDMQEKPIAETSTPSQLGAAFSMSPAETSRANSASKTLSFGGQRLRDTWTSLDEDQEIVQYWKGQLCITANLESCLSYLRRRQMKQKGTTLTTVFNPATWILHPSGPFCLVWNVLCIQAILYDIVTMPAEAFNFDREGLYSYVEGFLTIFWTIDLIISFRTGYLVGAHLETSQIKVAWRYLHSGFLLDAVIVLVEWSSWITQKLSSASVLKTTRVLRSFRVLKFVRVGKMKEIWLRLQDQVNSVVFHICVSLIVISICVAIGVHLTSCLWYWLGTSAADGWVTYDAYVGEKNVVFWYVASMRWSIAQLNGRTDEDDRRNMEERAFACFTGIVLAVIIKTTLVSVVTKTVLNLSSLRSSKIRRQTLVKEYLETHNISIGLRVSVKRYMYDYESSLDLCSKEEQVMGFLPVHLQGAILYEIRGPTVSNHPLFQSFGVVKHAIIRHICHEAVKLRSALHGEIVFDTGDACSRMLFVSGGKVEYGELAISVAESLDFKAGAEPTDPVARTSSASKPLALLRTRTEEISKAISRFRTSQSAVSLKGRRTADSAELSVDSETAEVVSNGGWLSEAALWVNWTNKKSCVAAALSVLHAVEAEPLSQVLSRHADAYAIAHLYAASFAKELSRAKVLSDVCPFQLKVSMPDRLPTPIQITIVGARGLKIASQGLIFFGKAHLFCVCTILGGEDETQRAAIKIKTDLQEGTSAPVWDHTEEVAVCRGHTLEFSVWDHSFGGKLMGSARLPAANVLRKGFAGELQLRGGSGAHAAGRLEVKIGL